MGGRHSTRGWPARVARMAAGGGDVRRAAIRALPTGAKLKPEVPVFKTGASGISIFQPGMLHEHSDNLTSNKCQSVMFSNVVCSLSFIS